MYSFINNRKLTSCGSVHCVLKKYKFQNIYHSWIASDKEYLPIHHSLVSTNLSILWMLLCKQTIFIMVELITEKYFFLLRFCQTAMCKGVPGSAVVMLASATPLPHHRLLSDIIHSPQHNIILLKKITAQPKSKCPYR